ncbi:MAG: hypothetical protein KKE05_06510 [Nanoarchaeota archaeon]|nr:hypothetical protein [Nanoarchaeota archaeon]
MEVVYEIMSKAEMEPAKEIVRLAGYKATVLPGNLNLGEFLVEVRLPERHEIVDYRDRFAGNPDYVGGPRSFLSISSNAVLNPEKDANLLERLRNETSRLGGVLRGGGYKTHAYELEINDEGNVVAAQTL